MKKLFLALSVCTTIISFSQKATHYDCSFTNENKKGCNYTELTKEGNTIRIDYFNCLNRIIKTEHYTNKYDIDKDHLNGLQILYNYDGSVYSSGYFKLGKKDSLWEINLRDSTKQHETFQSGVLLKSISLKENNDTISIRTNSTKGRPLSTIYFSDDGNRCKIYWYDSLGKYSITYMGNCSERIVDIKDSFKTDKDTTKKRMNVTQRTDLMPKFDGGNNAFSDYINDKLVYPENARKNGICGTVKIRFIVETDGSIIDACILNLGPAQHPDLEKEALRLIKKSSGMWEPGKQNGKPVKAMIVVPIEFSIE